MHAYNIGGFRCECALALRDPCAAPESRESLRSRKRPRAISVSPYSKRNPNPNPNLRPLRPSFGQNAAAFERAGELCRFLDILPPGLLGGGGGDHGSAVWLGTAWARVSAFPALGALLESVPANRSTGSGKVGARNPANSSV